MTTPYAIASGAGRWQRALLLLTVLVALSGCLPTALIAPPPRSLAAQAGFESWPVSTPDFDVQTFFRARTSRGGTLAVYVEGDGRAFDANGRVRRDPTPRQATALELAVRDPSDVVLYVARPCQYVDAATARGCHPALWSSHRYSRAVVDAVGEIVDLAQARWRPRQTGLVGFSGGGTIAAILGAERDDIDWLVTVSGNLDHARWTRHHNVTPLHGSLNAIDFAAGAGARSQLHLRGAEDDNVLPDWGADYRERAGGNANVQVRIVQGVGHECCWAERWPALLCESGLGVHPACMR